MKDNSGVRLPIPPGCLFARSRITEDRLSADTARANIYMRKPTGSRFFQAHRFAAGCSFALFIIQYDVLGSSLPTGA
jgi:hypothetical protein